jgi:hypothetical protein
MHDSLGFVTTRSNITFSTSNVKHFQPNPKSKHYQTVRKIFKFLCYIVGYGTIYRSLDGNFIFQPNQDLDFANVKIDRYSYTCHVVFLNNGPLMCGSHKQDILAMQNIKLYMIVFAI